jgi:sugar phosphate permease
MFSGAFGGLFAAGIAAAFANNKISSWRWLFMIEGAATVVFSIASMFVIPDWPATTKWLSEEERQLGVVRLMEDAGSEEEELSARHGFMLAMKDYRVWLAVIGQLCVQVCSYFRERKRSSANTNIGRCVTDKLPTHARRQLWI